MTGQKCSRIFIIPDIKSPESIATQYDRRVVLVERRLRERPTNRPQLRKPKILHRDRKTIEGLNLSNIWSMMHARCYDKSHRSYHQYGGSGIFVCDRWHDFRYFVEDVQRIPNFENKRYEPRNYQLDKDFYGSNCYSPQTCVWLHSSDNALYTKQTTPIIMESPSHKQFFVGVKHASAVLKMSTTALSKRLNSQSRDEHMLPNMDNTTIYYYQDDDYVVRFMDFTCERLALLI